MSLQEKFSQLTELKGYIVCVKDKFSTHQGILKGYFDDTGDVFSVTLFYRLKSGGYTSSNVEFMSVDVKYIDNNQIYLKWEIEYDYKADNL